MSKIAICAEELAINGRSGGIGAAVFELALLLRDNGHDVDLHYIPLDRPSPEKRKLIIAGMLDRGIRLTFIETAKYVWQEAAAQTRAYAVFAHFQEFNKAYDYIHFHDYKGLGYFCTNAKRQGVAFSSTIIVVQLHGPTRWTLQANRQLFTHQDQLLIDFMERGSIENADHVVSPSAYLLEWMDRNGFRLPHRSNVHVIKNAFSYCAKLCSAGDSSPQRPFPIEQIIFFGRHEARKGLVVFCDALDRLADRLQKQRVQVSFVGALGEVNGHPSGLYLTNRAKKWNFGIEAHCGFDRVEAMSFLRSRENALVVIPSHEENSPYAVIEAMTAGKAILTSRAGGAKELIDERFHDDCVVDIEPEALSERLEMLLSKPITAPQFSEDLRAVERRWLELHEIHRSRDQSVISLHRALKPKVVVGITHFERPRKVIGAIMSVMRQTYENIELIVVDDGSSSPTALGALDEIDRLLSRAGGRLLRRENGYLGAARNTIASNSVSDYLLFLDDDDLLFPNAIERLVEVASATGADIVNCFNLFLEESNRSQYELTPETFTGKLSYVPVGGPLSLAPLGNHMGAATALIKRAFFDKVGGYTEIKRVGYEDYEFYARALQAGADVQIVAEPLYLYEVGKPSMISSTFRMANKQRVVNAIDASVNAEQWKDLIELSAGRECIEDMANMLSWQTSISPQREQIERAISTRFEIEYHLLALAEYATAIHAPNMAEAWLSAAAVSMRAESDGKRVTTLRQLALIEDGPPEIGVLDVALASEIAGSLQLGRTAEAIDEILRAIAKAGEVSETVIEFCYVVADAEGLTAALAKPLIGVLSDSYIDETFTIRAQGAIVALYIGAGLFQNARAIMPQIEMEEAKSYVAHHPDIATAFGERAVSKALSHYKNHGFEENRAGFAILKKIAHIVGKRAGRNTKPWQVIYEIDRLLRSSRAPLFALRIW